MGICRNIGWAAPAFYTLSNGTLGTNSRADLTGTPGQALNKTCSCAPSAAYRKIVRWEVPKLPDVGYQIAWDANSGYWMSINADGSGQLRPNFFAGAVVNFPAGGIAVGDVFVYDTTLGGQAIFTQNGVELARQASNAIIENGMVFNILSTGDWTDNVDLTVYCATAPVVTTPNTASVAAIEGAKVSIVTDIHSNLDDGGAGGTFDVDTNTLEAEYTVPAGSGGTAITITARAAWDTNQTDTFTINVTQPAGTTNLETDPTHTTFIADAPGNAIVTLTTPNPTNCQHYNEITVKRGTAQVISIRPDTGHTIDGGASYPMPLGIDAVTFGLRGTDWLSESNLNLGSAEASRESMHDFGIATAQDVPNVSFTHLHLEGGDATANSGGYNFDGNVLSDNTEFSLMNTTNAVQSIPAPTNFTQVRIQNGETIVAQTGRISIPANTTWVARVTVNGTNKYLNFAPQSAAASDDIDAVYHTTQAAAITVGKMNIFPLLDGTTPINIANHTVPAVVAGGSYSVAQRNASGIISKLIYVANPAGTAWDLVQDSATSGVTPWAATQTVADATEHRSVVIPADYTGDAAVAGAAWLIKGRAGETYPLTMPAITTAAELATALADFELVAPDDTDEQINIPFTNAANVDIVARNLKRNQRVMVFSPTGSDTLNVKFDNTLTKTATVINGTGTVAADVVTIPGVRSAIIYQDFVNAAATSGTTRIIVNPAPVAEIDDAQIWAASTVYATNQNFSINTALTTAVDMDGNAIEANRTYIMRYRARTANQASGTALDVAEIALMEQVSDQKTQIVYHTGTPAAPRVSTMPALAFHTTNETFTHFWNTTLTTPAWEALTGGASTYQGLQVVATFTPPANTIYDNNVTVDTGIDFTRCDLIELTGRRSADLSRAITVFVPVVMGGVSPNLQFPLSGGGIDAHLLDAANAAIGRLTNVDCYTTGFYTMRIRGLAYAANGLVVPTASEVLTPRAITGSITSTGYDDVTLAYHIPLTAGQVLATVTLNGAATTNFNPTLGIVWITPNGADVVVAHTTTTGSTFTSAQIVTSIDYGFAGRIQLTAAAQNFTLATGFAFQANDEVVIDFCQNDVLSDIKRRSFVCYGASTTSNEDVYPAANNVVQAQWGATLNNVFSLRTDGTTNVDVLRITVKREAANGYAVPTGTVSYTARSITGAGFTAINNARDNTATVVQFPLTAGQEIDTFTWTGGGTVALESRGNLSQIGLLNVVPNGADIVLTITTRAVTTNTASVTNAGGNTNYKFSIPSRSDGKFSNLAFTFEDRRGGFTPARILSVSMPVGYFIPETNNGWTADFNASVWRLNRLHTMPDGSQYFIYVSWIATPDGWRFWIEDVHSATANTYGKVSNIVATFV